MALSADDLRRIDEEANRFEVSWRAGHFPKIEDFVAAFSARLQEALFRELLLVEIELRNEDRMRDEALSAPNKEEYLERFPSRHDVISEVIPPNPFPDEYRILRLLATGGHGKVWRAWDINIPRSVVLKNPRGDRDTIEILRNEAEKLAQVRHPNVVQIHAWRTANSDNYLVMEFVKGGSLDNLLSRLGRFPWEQATRYIADIGEALKAVHSHDIVHRDIKPANMLWDDQADEVRLTDFGCAVRLGDRTPSGTIPFMAPEVLLGESATPLADVYSLAATLFCLATGELPFRATRNGSSWDINDLVRKIRDGLPDPDDRCSCLPERIDSLIRDGLNPDPRRRISLNDFVDRLRADENLLSTDSIQTLPQANVNLRIIVSRYSSAGAFVPIGATPRGVERRDIRRVPPPPDQVTVADGDVLRIEVVADRDGHLTCLNVGPTGNLNPLHPDPHDAQAINRVPNLRANVPFNVGETEVSPPSGRERIVAIWSDQPLPLQVGHLWSLVKGRPGETSRGYRATRDIKRIKDSLATLRPSNWCATILELNHLTLYES